MRHIPITVAPGRSPPLHLTLARRCPDAMHRIAAYDTALNRFEDEAVVYWTVKPPKNAKPIPLTVSFQYKWDRTGASCMRKARCALRGDLKAPGTHYDHAHKPFPTAQKSTARLIFTISAGHGWAIEHLDIKNAYVHEPAMYSKEIYIRKIPRSNGNYAHGKSIGRLVKNL